ncbi:class I SAM-dependent methyltransferase [Methanoplanus sp. FWC-SCC4]|uniref:Class I SAM-dependent methyltransferase n=1 Tax=Methanochimaera problematica TaxID=2609417 RepID=A0AA97FGD4_9EURY|nr:class I SAM-dependent methyltransferase [Methanoplanus sp. FWC-SCC4]WOF16941.1 class I SAM-dependent methyltransferase [Methanoplanus sp. FWC-SCC4]
MDNNIIFEIFEGLPRQGPGDNRCTKQAFETIPIPKKSLKILDIGCGSGMQTIQLAKLCEDCTITATDIYQPYLDDLKQKSEAEDLPSGVITECVSMENLPYDKESFDIIWSEGSVFIMGFENGITYWKDFLKTGGYLCLTEAAWFLDNPSKEAELFWNEAYPLIKTIDGNIEIIKKCGYEIVDTFRLPESAWTDNYYTPVINHINKIRDDYRGNDEALNLIKEIEKEAEIYQKHHNDYGYVFFVLKKI